MHSLITFEEQMERLFHELDGKHWDVIVFSETWREEQEEIWETKRGHTWYASGGCRGSNGVGMLLNSRWTHITFEPLGERLCIQFILRVCGTYLPHSEYPDADVEATYAALDAETEGGEKPPVQVYVSWRLECASRL